jgi:hypothetical protein
MILFVIITCEKDDKTDPFYTDFHDILFIPMGINQLTPFDIDLDKDKIIDLSIKIKEGYSHYGSYDSYIQLYPKNSYEILFSIIVDTAYEWSPNAPDTSFSYYRVLMPKINNIGDIINITDKFTDDTIMLVYNEVPHPMIRPYSKGIERNQWVGIGYKYIVFRKSNATVNKLAWLKVKVLNGTELMISSSRYFEKKDVIKIEDE